MVTLDEKVIEAKGLTLAEVLLLIAIQNSADFTEAEVSLLKKGFISRSYDSNYKPDGFFITNAGKNILFDMIVASDKVVGTGDFTTRIEALVPKLQGVFPEGKNFNNQYWRGNKTDIKRKLQTFFKKYGDDYTDEQILNATQAYVSGFNGTYQYMRLLQYFIWKEEVKDGTKVPVSDLANYIENAGQERDLTSDWTTEVV